VHLLSRLQTKREKPILLVGGLEAGLLADAYRARWAQQNPDKGVVVEINPGTQMSKAEFVTSMFKGIFWLRLRTSFTRLAEQIFLKSKIGFAIFLTYDN
jgi:hypothetical protein